MLRQIRLSILRTRVARLREHVENVGESPDFTRELAKAEAELRAVEQQEVPR